MNVVTIKLEKVEYTTFFSEEDSLLKSELQKAVETIKSAGREVIILPKCEVESFNLGNGDFPVFYIDVGDMAPHRAQEYIDRVKENTAPMLGAGIAEKAIYMARTSAGRGSYIEVLNLGEGQRAIFYVDVGSLPPEKAHAYLERIRSEIRENIPELANAAFLPISTNSGVTVEILPNV